jgi:dienelactone hydrolase
MELRIQSTERGVVEQRFELRVADEPVPGLVWTPEDAGGRGARPLVLIGHGGTQHKRTPNVLSLARRLVRHHGYVAAAIDAPEHGERLRPEDAERQRETRSALSRGQGRPISADRLRLLAERAAQATREWKAVLDALSTLPVVDGGRVGYWGLSMGTAFGVPLLAAEPRVKAAVLGLAGLRPGAEAMEQAARSVQIPLLFIFQLDDELMTPEAGLALFKAFGSKVKTMHMNPGAHVATPMFERDDYETFFVRHLGSGVAEAAAE